MWDFICRVSYSEIPVWEEHSGAYLIIDTFVSMLHVFIVLLCWFALIGKIAYLWGICLNIKVNPWSWPHFVKLDPEVATELPILRQANIDCYWTNKKENTMEPRFGMLVVIKAVVQIYWCRSFNCNTVEW